MLSRCTQRHCAARCRLVNIVNCARDPVVLEDKKLKCHSSALLRVLAKICYPEILSIANKYNIQCLDVSVGQANSAFHPSGVDK